MNKFGKVFACICVFGAVVAVLCGELLPAAAMFVGGISVWVSSMIAEEP